MNTYSSKAPDRSPSFADDRYIGSEPGDVIDLVIDAWKPGYFTPRELARSAMLVVGISPPYIDTSLEALAADLIKNDRRPKDGC